MGVPMLEFGALWQRAMPLPLGKTASRLPEPSADPKSTLDERLVIAVVGAHLTGQKLNGELLALGARLRRTARTAPAAHSSCAP